MKKLQKETQFIPLIHKIIIMSAVYSVDYPGRLPCRIIAAIDFCCSFVYLLGNSGTVSAPNFPPKMDTGMNQELESFRLTIAEDVKKNGVMAERWNQRSQQIIDKLAETGVTGVNREDVALSSSARIYALSGQESGNAVEELTLLLPQIKHQAELREVRAALTREDHPQHNALQAKLDAMSPHQKMEYARTLPSAKASQTREYTAIKKAELIRQNARLPYQLKIDHARKHGLV